MIVFCDNFTCKHCNEHDCMCKKTYIEIKEVLSPDNKVSGTCASYEETEGDE